MKELEVGLYSPTTEAAKDEMLANIGVSEDAATIIRDANGKIVTVKANLTDTMADAKAIELLTKPWASLSKSTDKASRVKVWVPDVGQTEKEFYDEWVKKMFEIEEEISRGAFVITLPVQLSSNFEGIYIVKEFPNVP